MNTETTKTVSFVAVAVVLSAAAWFSRPVVSHQGEAQSVGEKLFKDFTSSDKVESLKVVQFDQKAGEPLALEVAKVNNLWVIPSHGNYAADAEPHLAEAANSLIDLKIIGMAPGFASGSPSMNADMLHREYNKYGVIDPDSAKDVKSTDTGVGTHVTMKDHDGRELAAVIIGKPVPEQSNQCYLRVPGKDPVFIVQLDPSKLSARFTDWIERNFLNLTMMDLKQVDINNYSFEPKLDASTGQIVLTRSSNGEYRIDLPSGDQSWKLAEELAYDKASHKMAPVKLAANEELNTTALDAMKTALEDLKIVNVERKPAQVPPDLRVGKLDNDTVQTLMERGYIVNGNPQDPNSKATIYSKNGEINLQLSDGARYILRFGATTGESSAAEAEKHNKGAAKEGDSSPGLDRFLFVMAEFNQDAIPKPVVEQLPPEEKKEEKPAPKPEEKKDEKKIDAKDAKAADATKKDEPKKTEPGKDAGKDVKKDEPKKLDPVAEAEKAKQRAAEKVRIDMDNQRHKDEYETKVAAGKKHVKELNDRFAQWYYVIPGDVYDKIHLDHKSIVKKKEPPKDAHDHEHEHDHEHGLELPVGPAGALNKLPEPEAK